jgi:hypothetical protein
MTSCLSRNSLSFLNKQKIFVMKTYTLLLLSLVFCIIISGCSKKSDNPKYPAPHWQADTSSSHAYSMTAVIAISDSLKQTVSKSDEVAAFAGEECRGVGVFVEREGKAPVFYVLIKGTADEQVSLKFKYYNAKTAFMYSTAIFLNFTIDDNYGTVDVPALPDFLQE